jgi:hypothetical protein
MTNYVSTSSDIDFKFIYFHCASSENIALFSVKKFVIMHHNNKHTMTALKKKTEGKFIEKKTGNTGIKIVDCMGV